MIFSFNKDPFLYRRTSESWEPWAGPGGNKPGERLSCRIVVVWIEPGIKERENRFTVSKGARSVAGFKLEQLHKGQFHQWYGKAGASELLGMLSSWSLAMVLEDDWRVAIWLSTQ